MSIIHINQIKRHVEQTFAGLIDLADVVNAAPASKESLFLTRALAAYAIAYLSDTPADVAAKSVTDGGDDNGIDAVYYDKKLKRLYLVQSKWIHDGVGEPSNGDVKKFLSGVRDLFNMKFDRFNGKLKALVPDVASALNDPSTRYELVLVYTGSSKLSVHSARDLSDITREMNDTSDVVFTTTLNQADLHSSLTAAVAGEPISLQIGLKSWGKKDDPHLAIYGQVSGRQIAEWWAKHRARLFTQNLRSILGDTDVNSEMRTTLEESPQSFWYFNNGITIVARRAAKAMAGGGDSDFATFHCEDISVVNGAQTVGTIGKFGEQGLDALDQVFVPVRVIVRDDDQAFAESVTRTNNRQNRIDGRDFVALDPEQSRIKTDLAIDGIDYQIMRTESFVRSDKSFDLVEATTAMACSTSNVRLVVQLKREIGKLWDDTSKGPYKELFNGGVTGLRVWRSVQVQRMVDRAIETYASRVGTDQRYGITTHGNRLISALVFKGLPTNKFDQPSFELKSGITEKDLVDSVDSVVLKLAECVAAHYQNAIIPTLFKNQTKCEHLFKEVVG